MNVESLKKPRFFIPIALPFLLAGLIVLANRGTSAFLLLLGIGIIGLPWLIFSR